MARRRIEWLAAPLLCVAAQTAAQPGAADAEAGVPGVDAFFDVATLDDERARAARDEIAAGWRDGYAALLVDQLDVMRRTSLVNPSDWIRLTRVAGILEAETGQQLGLDVDRWREWIWSLPYEPHPAYGEFKGRLYARLDPRFETFFEPPVKASIRLDEIQWGGVEVNGIPPLDYPEHVAADSPAAGFLDDDNVVFGVAVDGAARAYPKRILAWHELARDAVGGRELTVVYCTLCGTVIPFESEAGGVLRTFGTSGLLYQSNKLMFDEGTRSLWSSLTGTPVVGPLVGSRLELEAVPVVTTTWGEWRLRHPDTTVLSLDTGHRRDYSEGAAYRQYFATDRLMFDVSNRDGRLANKDEVLALRIASEDGTQPVAISARFLLANRVYHVEAAPELVVVTSSAGANRVYAAGPRRFERLDADGRVVDGRGRTWRVTEDALVATFDDSERAARVPAHRAFWFGWYAQHPDTLLIGEAP